MSNAKDWERDGYQGESNQHSHSPRSLLVPGTVQGEVGEEAKRRSCLQGAHSGEKSPANLEVRDKAKTEPARIRGVRREVREIFQENSFLGGTLQNGLDFSRLGVGAVGWSRGEASFVKTGSEKKGYRLESGEFLCLN